MYAADINKVAVGPLGMSARPGEESSGCIVTYSGCRSVLDLNRVQGVKEGPANGIRNVHFQLSSGC